MSFENGLICVMKCDNGHPHMIVRMTHIIHGIRFDIQADNLPDGLHGFHVHQTGNLTDGCKTLGPHYNPTSTTHGGLNETRSHSGDLGNIEIHNGKCSMTIVSYKLRLPDLLGRSLVLHSGRDDLGRGGNAESLETGNSGSRICCGVIGYK